MISAWSDDESQRRRYPSRSSLVSNDRYPAMGGEGDRPSSRAYNLASLDARGIERELEQDSSGQQPRKRVAVACGRCRKRKIRCSGDPMTGMSCTNCKNSGQENCQFLRVQSEEAHLKDNAQDFGGYDSIMTRPFQCSIMPQNGHGLYDSYPQSQSLSNLSRSTGPYRGGIMSDLYGSKSCYALPYTNDYSDPESVEYGLLHSYPSLTSDHVGLPSTYNSSHRSWMPTLSTNNNSKPNASANGIYVNSENGSQFNTLSHIPSQQQPLSLRHSVSCDTNNFSFGNMASSLPNASSLGLPAGTINGSISSTTASTDRMLPLPATHRTASMPLNPYSRTSTESLPNLPVFSNSNTGSASASTSSGPIKATNSNSHSQPLYMNIPTTSDYGAISQLLITGSSEDEQGHVGHSVSAAELYPSPPSPEDNLLYSTVDSSTAETVRGQQDLSHEHGNGHDLHESNEVEGLYAHYGTSSGSAKRGDCSGRRGGGGGGGGNSSPGTVAAGGTLTSGQVYVPHLNLAQTGSSSHNLYMASDAQRAHMRRSREAGGALRAS